MLTPEAGGGQFPRSLPVWLVAEDAREEVEEGETLVTARTLWVLMWAHSKGTPSVLSAWAGLHAPILQIGKQKLQNYPLADLQRQVFGLEIQALFPHTACHS